MKQEVRFSVSDESEVSLQRVMDKLKLSRNQAAHFCLSLGAALVNALVPDMNKEELLQKLIEGVGVKVASELAPGLEKTAQTTISVLMQNPDLLGVIAGSTES